MRIPASGDAALVALTPVNISAAINRWRQAYDLFHALIPPHITIAYHPFVPLAAWPEVAPSIAARLRERECFPFDVRLVSLGTFPGNPAVLWLRPEEDGRLTRLHRAVAETLPAYTPELPFSYVPHLTLGFFETDAALEAARSAIAVTFVPIEFRVEELAYVVCAEAGCWDVHGRISLGQV